MAMLPGVPCTNGLVFAVRPERDVGKHILSKLHEVFRADVFHGQYPGNP